MTTDVNQLWIRQDAAQLAQALVAIDTKTDMQNFLRDVMTEKEIIEISSRLQAARMLKAGKTYNEIVERTKLSSRTVARVSDWMANGAGGYASVLARFNSHHDHIRPARAA